MSFGNFYKGDKKKKKKGQGGNVGTSLSGGPIFTPPTVLPKGKIKY